MSSGDGDRKPNDRVTIAWSHLDLAAKTRRSRGKPRRSNVVRLAKLLPNPRALGQLAGALFLRNGTTSEPCSRVALVDAWASTAGESTPG